MPRLVQLQVEQREILRMCSEASGVNGVVTGVGTIDTAPTRPATVVVRRNTVAGIELLKSKGFTAVVEL